MSRCFPFPPPGYEKKARTDDVDLLKKEKHKEKKHKKDKKVKEKRDDKDSKDKDKSDRKHRDKKDRKEKSKEKKKDKEREKDRDKTSTSSDRKIPAQVESSNGDQKRNHKEREWIVAQNITSNQKIQNTQFLGHIGDKPVEKSLYDEGSVDKFVLDLCSRINDEEKGSVSQSTVRSPFTGRTNHDRMVKIENGIMPMEKEKNMDKRVDMRKVDGQGVSVGATFSASKMVQNIVGEDKNENKGVNIGAGFQNKAEESPWILQRIEPRDKNCKKENEDKRESKHKKDKHKEKKSHGKDKEREKEKKKVENAKEKNEQKTNDHDKVKDTVKNGHVFGQIMMLAPLVPNGDGNLPQNIKLPQFDRDGDRNHIFRQNIKLPPFVPDCERTPAVGGNFMKRKEFEANGFLHETNIVPNKKLRPTSHPSIENGRKLEPCQASILRTPGRKVPPPNNLVKVNTNEHKVNGKIKVQPLAISLKKPSSSSSSSSSSSKIKADQIAKTPPVKLPHPDTKYLGEVLSVPKIKECFDFDDEEWFCSSKGHVSMSAVLTEASETPRVWAQPVQIESADVCALPYVIPY